jgi:purine-binding chemotaxis protein CheW
MSDVRPRYVKAGSWKRLQERLRQALAATDAALADSPERAQAVLEERARALARVPTEALRGAEVLEVVEFGLAGERYAIETRYVRAVVRSAGCVPVPGAPDFLAGLLNLHGEPLAVVDLLRFFGVSGGLPGTAACVVVLGCERAEFAVLADAVDEVQRLPLDEVLAPPDSTTGTGRECLRGVTANALVVLDGARLLQDSRLFIDQTEDGALAPRPRP